MPADGEGLDLALKIFILAMKIQNINWEEKGEQGGEESEYHSGRGPARVNK